MVMGAYKVLYSNNSKNAEKKLQKVELPWGVQYGLKKNKKQTNSGSKLVKRRYENEQSTELLIRQSTELLIRRSAELLIL